jgi:hypothetical protein
MTTRNLAAAAATLVCASLMACNGNSSTSGTGTADASVTTSVAMAMANAASNDAAVMRASSTDTADIAFDHIDVLHGCVYAAGQYTCVAHLLGGLDFQTTIAFYDSTGATETAYDSTATDSVRIAGDLSGSVTIGDWSATISRHRTFVVSGLAGTETSRTWNGSGGDTLTSTLTDSTGTTQQFSIAGSVTAQSVVVPVGDGTHWPTSGTVTGQLTVKSTSGADNGKSYQLNGTITFNGTAEVPLVVNQTTFIVDLATGTAVQSG